jgi:hypothetical protein
MDGRRAPRVLLCVRKAALLLSLIVAWPALAVCPNWTAVQATGFAFLRPVMADLDGDGRPDAISFGRGIGVFWAPTFFSSTGVRDDFLFDTVAVGDFDGDGRLDIAAGTDRLGAPLEIFLNLGGRKFDRQRFIYTWRPVRLVAADLDGDRFSDLIFINDINEITTLRNNGSGDFEAPVPLHLGARPTILIGADFDGDRRTDAAFVDLQAENVLRTTSGWSFTAPGPIKAAVTADFDRDGRPELVLIAGDRAVLLRTIAGGFERIAELVPGTPPTDVAVADFNRDGTPDVAVAATDRIAVWLNDGSGGFRRVADTPAMVSSITAIDFNSDGITDLVNAGALLTGIGNGTFALMRAMQSQETYVAAAADVDGDGDTDFAAAGGELMLWRNDRGMLVPEDVGPSPGVGDLKIADLDGDGVQELIVSTSDLGSRTILVYRSAPSASRLWFSLPADRGFYRIAVGDFGGDGRPELAVRANGVVQLFAATPEPRVVGQVAGLPDFEPRFAADFDHDGRDDLLLLRRRTTVNGPPFIRNNGAVALLPGRGNFTFGPPVMIAQEVTASDVNLGDFDGDGNRDVAIELSNGLEIAYGDGRGAFTRVAVPNDPNVSYLESLVPVVADLDGDGRDELLGSYPFAVVAAIFLGDRGQPARRVVTIQTPLRYAFAVGQVDADGLDVVTFGFIHPGLCAPSAHRRPR